MADEQPQESTVEATVENADDALLCAFCDKSQNDVAILVQARTGQRPCICNECIAVCVCVMSDHAHQHAREATKIGELTKRIEELVSQVRP